MSVDYAEQAAQAMALVARGERHDCPQWLVVELFTCLALSSDGREATLAIALELVDVRQHMVMTIEEIASAAALLVELGLVARQGTLFVFPDPVWQSLPRTRRGRLDASQRATPKWVRLVADRLASDKPQMP